MRPWPAAAAQELRQTQPMVDLAKAAEAEYKLQAKLIWDDGSYGVVTSKHQL